MDFTKSWDLTNLATVVLPRGKKLDESPIEDVDAYTTVESVNEGSIYVESQEAVDTYGWIETVVDWSDIDEPATLLEKAKEYLADIQFDEMVLEVKAVDLHYLSKDIEAINLLDQIYCISRPHGMDRLFPATKISIPLDSPENTQYTFGSSEKSSSLTSKNKQTNEDIRKKIDSIPSKQSILKSAQANASQLINSATNGYISLVMKDNYTEELIISDTTDYLKATRLWKWNINGLGYSEDGGKTFGLAMTMDGQIVADYITAGTLTADVIRMGILTDRKGKNWLNLETGECSLSGDTKLDGSDTISNKFTVLNNSFTSELSSLRDDLSGYDRRISTISQTVNSITTEVSGLSDDVSSFSSRLSVAEGQISSKVSRGSLSSEISQEVGQITIKSNRLVINSTYFNLTADGKITATSADLSGTLKTKNVQILDNEVDFYDGASLIGKIKFNTGQSVYGPGSSLLGNKDLFTIRAADFLALKADEMYVSAKGNWYRGYTGHVNFEKFINMVIKGGYVSTGKDGLDFVNGVLTSMDGNF